MSTLAWIIPARRALAAEYGLRGFRLWLMSSDWNLIFGVKLPDGRRYVLRIAVPEHTAPEIQSEALWLQAISQDGRVRVPTPIPTQNGDFVMTLRSGDKVRFACLFEHLPGSMPDPMTPDRAALWGATMATLHQQAVDFVPPQGFSRVRYDTVFPFRTDTVVLFSPTYQHLLPDPQPLRDTLYIVQASINRLYADDPAGLRLIHNDLHMWNLLVDGDRVAVIDFDDIMWGYPAQDIGTALYYIMGNNNETAIRDAFQQGYEAHLPWVDDTLIDHMIMARRLNLYNLMLLESDDPAPYFERLQRHVSRFLTRFG